MPGVVLGRPVFTLVNGGRSAELPSTRAGIEKLVDACTMFSLTPNARNWATTYSSLLAASTRCAGSSASTS